MSYGLQFFVICAMVLFACTKVTLQGFVSRRYVRNSADVVLFNAQLFVVIALFLSVLFPLGRIDTAGVLLAILTGFCTVVFQISYVMALKSGPVSLTVLIGNFALLFVTVFSVVFFHEAVYLTQFLGIGFLILSLLLSVKKENDEKAISGKWLFYVFLMTLMNAAAAITMKIFFAQISSEYENSQNTFMSIFYVVAAALAFAYYFFLTHTGKKEKNTYGFFNPHVLLYVLVIGCSLGLYQRFYMIGLEKIDGGFLFPTYSGMQTLVMTLIGVFLFRDKLSRRQMIGIVCGIVCVVLMNARFMKLF